MKNNPIKVKRASPDRLITAAHMAVLPGSLSCCAKFPGKRNQASSHRSYKTNWPASRASIQSLVGEGLIVNGAHTNQKHVSSCQATTGLTGRISSSHPREIRALIRAGKWQGPTAGLAPGYVQANLVMIPASLAEDFARFCELNPRPCPVLEVTQPGQTESSLAPGSDLRTDLPRYRVYRHGELVRETVDVLDEWRPDLVAFLIGCSFTFESALLREGIPVRHIEQGRNVPMYITNIPLVPCGPFHGKMVVSMRPFEPHNARRAAEITARFPRVHGGPVHMGSPDAIGITDLSRPDYGDAVDIRPGEVPVFWACGVTPQAVALESKPEMMITHSPGCMFITDMRDSDLEEHG